MQVEMKEHEKDLVDQGLEKHENEAKKAQGTNEDEEQAKTDPDVLYVQDVGFSLNISAPGMEEFKIQASVFINFLNLAFDEPFPRYSIKK